MSTFPIDLTVNLLKTFHLNTFVETGTAGGETSETAAALFARVYTCELDPDYYSAAWRRLLPYPNVKTCLMDSPKFLSMVRPMFHEPVLFWLDAHYDGPATGHEVQHPLLEELRAINGLRGKDVVLIDDARLLGSDGWPTVKEIHEVVDHWARLQWNGWNGCFFRLIDDVILLTPQDVFQEDETAQGSE